MKYFLTFSLALFCLVACWTNNNTAVTPSPIAEAATLEADSLATTVPTLPPTRRATLPPPANW